MVTFRQIFFASWVVLAVIVRHDLIPFLVDVLGTSVDLTVIQLSIWKIYTYVVLVYLCQAISEKMKTLYEMAIRSNITTLLAAVIIILGLLSAIDIAYAYTLGDGRLFMVQMLYNAVSDLDGTIDTVSVAAQTVVETSKENVTYIDA
ncbi:hypothetical protein [Methanolobus sp. WCC4]|uniref:hypothetical protein n=1 Tax=Methanolobus sp. WCC4 TaxID=3125784 RepID=UPI0030FBED28